MPYDAHGSYVSLDRLDDDELNDWESALCDVCGRGRDECCGDSYCDTCHGSDDDDYGDDDDYDGGGVIRNYSYKPDPVFRGGRGGEAGLPFYGMEIEVETTRRQTDGAWFLEKAGPDLVYLKADGSVRGFEIVTHPMTYPWAMEHFSWDALAGLKDRGCTVRPDQNGIHVHVSRSGFDSDAHALRWFKLIYRNQDDIVRIARRRAGGWAKFSAEHRAGQFNHLKAMKGQLSRLNRESEQQLRELESAYIAEYDRIQYRYDDRVRRGESWYFSTAQQQQYNEMMAQLEPLQRRYEANRARLQRRFVADSTRRDRYSAINTQPEATFEVRLFASTLDPVTAQSTIGLCAATVEYTRHLTAATIIRDAGLSWPAFSAWLDGQPLYAAVKLANDKAVAPPGGGRAVI